VTAIECLTLRQTARNLTIPMDLPAQIVGIGKTIARFHDAGDVLEI